MHIGLMNSLFNALYESLAGFVPVAGPMLRCLGDRRNCSPLGFGIHLHQRADATDDALQSLVVAVYVSQQVLLFRIESVQDPHLILELSQPRAFQRPILCGKVRLLLCGIMLLRHSGFVEEMTLIVVLRFGASYHSD